MQSMKGATSLLGSMNRQMNLPALQRIAMEFEKENDIMDQRQEMMDDAIDDVTGVEDEEEGEEVVKEVLDEIGVDLGQAVSSSLIASPGGVRSFFPYPFDKKNGQIASNSVLSTTKFHIIHISKIWLTLRFCLGKIQLGETPSGLQKTAVADGRVAEAIGGAGGHGASNDDDDLQARLDSLRR